MPRVSERDGFERADSNNLPPVSFMMVARFVNRHLNFTGPEMGGGKLERSARPDYVDQSVGYVQLQRDGNRVTIFCKVTPEHKIKKGSYTVSCIIDEREGQIIEGKCEDCAASSGGCKHLIAFLFWLNRRSEEPSPTSTTSYWRKSSLSSISGPALASLQDISGQRYLNPADSSFDANEFIKECKDKGVKNIISCMNSEKDMISLHHLKVLFMADSGRSHASEDFILFCEITMKKDHCKMTERLTKGQSESPHWYEYRYGRITSSTAYEVSRCHTTDGSLVNKIMGSVKAFQSRAMERGKELEPKVLKKVAKQLKVKIIESGLLLDPTLPIFGASPDGIGPDFVVEIKCPSKEATVSNYILPCGSVAPKYYGQIQMHIHFANVSKGLFVVADTEFEKSGEYKSIWVNRDDEFLNDMINKCQKFWCENIFKLL